MTPPEKLTPNDSRLAPTLALIKTAFAAMDGRINPPSSAHRLTLADLQKHCLEDEVWITGTGPLACMILQSRADHLYLGKLAVAEAARQRGYARQLVTLAEARARKLALPALKLQTRVELTENHAVFKKLGFLETGRTRHPGYAHDTSITFTKTP